MPFEAIGLAFSSPTTELAPPELGTAVDLLTNGLRKGGMAWLWKENVSFVEKEEWGGGGKKRCEG